MLLRKFGIGIICGAEACWFIRRIFLLLYAQKHHATSGYDHPTDLAPRIQHKVNPYFTITIHCTKNVKLSERLEFNSWPLKPLTSTFNLIKSFLICLPSWHKSLERCQNLRIVRKLTGGLIGCMPIFVSLNVQLFHQKVFQVKYNPDFVQLSDDIFTFPQRRSSLKPFYQWVNESLSRRTRGRSN